jgi:hypothetical protein
VELTIEGADTELDKTVIDQLNDPLVHLVRNSMDHGIETPEARRAAGKPPTARIHLSATHSGANVLIRVSDDGRGLDVDAIRARAIEQGYNLSGEPYHGYFLKVLKGQGPAAPLGEMDYVVKGVMIGGFALVAAPAEYGQTGLKTFIVSQDGVVYQKDFGAKTLDEFKKMERFNPDQSWTPLLEQ